MMKLHSFRFATLVVGLAVTMLFDVGTVLACPFCSAPDVTLSEQLQQADVAALAQWVSGKPANRDEGFAGSTTYEIVDIVHDASGTLKKGGQVTLQRHRAGKPGDLFLLLGSLSTVVEWASPLEVTETSYQYIKQAPSREAPTIERLTYFMQFLESKDKLIADDAYGEFAGAPYEDIQKLTPHMSRKKLRTWLADEKTPVNRLGLYGLMLGLCGNQEDAEWLKEKILAPSKGYRIGIDGLMAGYALLVGEKALDVLDEEKLRDKKEPFSEQIACMQALRFLWTYAGGRIRPERLRQSMRLLVDNPDTADLVINDLARWQDWGLTERLTTIYDKDDYNIPSIKRAIIRFMLAAVDSIDDKQAEQKQPDYVKTATTFLKHVQEKDPKLYRDAKKYYFR